MKKFKTVLKNFDTEKGVIYNGIEFNPVPGLPTIFASKCGKIYSSYTGELKYIAKLDNGYSNFPCYKNKKNTTMIVSRAVLMAWAEFPNNLTEEEFLKNEYDYEANHINEKNKSDNSISNLEWVDREYNNTYGTRCQRQSVAMQGNQNAKGRKNTPETFDRYLYMCDGKEFEKILELAAYLGVSKSALTEAFRKGKTRCGGKEIKREILPKKEVFVGSKDKKVKKTPTTKLKRSYRLYNINNELVCDCESIEELCTKYEIKSRTYIYKSNKTGEYFYPNFVSKVRYRAEVSKEWIEI